MWDQMPDVAGQALTVNAGITATAAAQSGDFAYSTANGEVTIFRYTGIPVTIGIGPNNVLAKLVLDLHAKKKGVATCLCDG
jgi:hypothetical protein